MAGYPAMGGNIRCQFRNFKNLLMRFSRGSILIAMSAKPLSRILALLVAAAYIGATMLQAAPTYVANADMSGSSMNGMTHEQDGPGDKMPCKGMPPNCVTDIGCILLVSVPTPDLNLFTKTSWSSVIYDNASKALRGRTIKPALGPPISPA
jgi:hypothetical protein